jgi:hypothetical protein
MYCLICDNIADTSHVDDEGIEWPLCSTCLDYILSSIEEKIELVNIGGGDFLE